MAMGSGTARITLLRSQVRAGYSLKPIVTMHESPSKMQQTFHCGLARTAKRPSVRSLIMCSRQLVSGFNSKP